MSAPFEDSELQHFRKFPAVSLPLFILLMLATLGIYAWWWMYSRSQWLNAELPAAQRIDQRFIHLCLGGFVATLVLAVAVSLHQEDLSLISTLNFLSLLLNVLVIVWTLLFRRGVNALLGEKQQAHHFNLFWVLLLQVVYMQYKINQIRAANPLGLM